MGRFLIGSILRLSEEVVWLPQLLCHNLSPLLFPARVFFFPGHLDCQHKSGLHCRRRRRRPWHRLVGLQQRRVKHRQHMWPRHKLKLLIKGVVDLSCESLRAAAPAAAAEKKKPCDSLFSSPHAASVQTKVPGLTRLKAVRPPAVLLYRVSHDQLIEARSPWTVYVLVLPVM